MVYWTKAFSWHEDEKCLKGLFVTGTWQENNRNAKSSKTSVTVAQLFDTAMYGRKDKILRKMDYLSSSANVQRSLFFKIRWHLSGSWVFLECILSEVNWDVTLIISINWQVIIAFLWAKNITWGTPLTLFALGFLFFNGKGCFCTWMVHEVGHCPKFTIGPYQMKYLPQIFTI